MKEEEEEIEEKECLVVDKLVWNFV